MAYWTTYDQAMADGQTFLVSCVHEGVHASYELPFADPGCQTQEQMASWMRELDIHT